MVLVLVSFMLFLFVFHPCEVLLDSTSISNLNIQGTNSIICCICPGKDREERGKSLLR